MKKWLVLLFVSGITTITFAQHNTEQLIGKWKYTVDTGSEIWTGVFKFTDSEGKITGEVTTDKGATIPFSKIESGEKNLVNLEIKTDNDLIKIAVKLEGNKFSGKGSSYQGEAPITGEKIIEP